MSYKGKFKPKNIKKYRGDPTKITYRSLWELRFMRYCDNTAGILMWASEEVIIPYRSPIDGKVHRYFPDFWIRVKTADGTIEETLIEVKPKAQTRPPTGGPPKDGRKRRRYISEVKTWGVNEAKWRAAQSFCDTKGWKFKILTEDDLTKF
jgi:hypothetical protein